METELDRDVERRAALHAALADPGRLRIVDLLTVGDLAPSELGAALDVSSNLLAHHLKVLAGQGLVIKTRSEGDRRRSYLHLLPAALDGLQSSTRRSAPRVLFVCTANSARSHLAAALWRRASRVPVASAGTHPAECVNPGAVTVAARHQLPLPRVKPRDVQVVRAADDLVITVCDRAHEALADPTALHWSVPDPVPTGTDAAFDAAFTDLARRVDYLAGHVTFPN